MEYKIDCLLIGHNEVDFNEYVNTVKKMGVNSGAYKDLLSNYININNKAYNAKQVYNYFANKQVDLNEVFSATIAYLGTFLNKHELSFDYIKNFHKYKDKLKELLITKKIISVAITTTLYVSVFPIMEILNFIRKNNKDVKIIIGGPFITTQYKVLDAQTFQYLLKTINADFYINSSQGELALTNVLKAIKNKLSYDDIYNIIYKKDNQYIFTDLLEEQNKLSENMVKWDLFNDVGSYLNVRTTISCPFTCSFCAFPEHAGKYQTASVTCIEKELDAIEAKKTVKSIFFVDDTLNVPGERFKELLKMMIRKNYSFNWYSHYRCQFADEETVKLMKDSGCEGVFLGIESGSDIILSNMNKKVTSEQFIKGIRLLKEYDITTHASFIMGFPGETRETVKETMDFIHHSDVDYFRVQLWYCDITTPIYRQGKEEFGITGSQFEWKHNTMDSKTAIQYMNDINFSIKDRIHIPNYFDMDAIVRLRRSGISKKMIDKFLIVFNDCVKDRLIADSDHNISQEREKQFRALFSNNILENININDKNTVDIDFAF